MNIGVHIWKVALHIQSRLCQHLSSYNSNWVLSSYSLHYNCYETACKHHIVFWSKRHLAWFSYGPSQQKTNMCKKIAIFAVRHWLKHHISQKLFNINMYMLRVFWQALNCLSIDAICCMIVAGHLQGKQKCWLLYVKMAIFSSYSLNKWQTIEHR